MDAVDLMESGARLDEANETNEDGGVDLVLTSSLVVCLLHSL